MTTAAIQTAWEDGFLTGLSGTGRASCQALKERYSKDHLSAAWIPPTKEELELLQEANQKEASLKEGTPAFEAIHFPSQLIRLRTPEEQGGKGCPCDLQRIAQLGFNAGAQRRSLGNHDASVPSVWQYLVILQ